jgi:hypothetical protein
MSARCSHSAGGLLAFLFVLPFVAPRWWAWRNVLLADWPRLPLLAGLVQSLILVIYGSMLHCVFWQLYPA